MSEEIEQYIQGLKVAELKEELKKRRLSYNGLKAALAQRLQEAMMNEEASSQGEDAVPSTNEESKVNVEDLGGEQTEDTEQNIDIENDESQQNEEEKIIDIEKDEQQDEQKEQQLQDNSDEPQPVETSSSLENPPKNAQDEIKKSEENPSEEPNEDSFEVQVPTEEPIEKLTEESSSKEQSNDKEPQSEEKEETMDVTAASSSQNESSAELKKEEKEDNNMETAADQEQPSKEEDTNEETRDAPGEEKMEENEEDDNENDDEEKRGMKRTREDDDEDRDDKKESKEEKKQKDPRDIRDPESVPDWSDENVQAICNNLFVLPEENTSVTLNPYKSDLHFIINSDGLGGSPLTEGGFAYMSANAKASWGIKKGCYFFECKLEEKLPVAVKEGEEEEEQPSVVRIGWSSLDSNISIGEDKYSYCYESTGKKINRSESEDYGESFDEGDVIGCYLNLSEDSKTIFFTKNGTNLNEAFNLTETSPEGSLFPHIGVKNFRITLNFGANPPSFPPVEGYTCLQDASEEDRECVSTEPVSKSNYEVILMVGLPGSGKTYWASKHLLKYPEREYHIIGPYQLFDKMTMKNKASITEWKDFVQLTGPMMNTLLVLASKLPCSYIIDQVNVYREAQKHKMKLFEGFIRKSLVVIPPHHELRKRRVDRIRDGGCMELPQELLDAFKANFHIPKEDDDLYDEVNFSEIYGPASDKIVRQYRDDALGLPTPYIPSKRPRYEPSRNRNSYGSSYGSSYSSSYSSSYASHRSKGGPYNYGPYGSSTSRYYQPPPPSRSYYAPPPPPHYRSGYYPPPPPSSFGGSSWGGNHHRGRYDPPPLPPPSHPRYGAPPPRPYYNNRGGGSGSGYYNRY